MDDAGIRQALQEIAEETLQWTEALPEGDLAEHLDSIDRLALVIAIEDRFEVAFDEAEDEGVHTVADIVSLVSGKIAEKADA